MDTTPVFTDDTIVFGLLMLTLGFVFYTSTSENKFWKKFYKYIPALLMAYMLPAALTTFGIIAPEWGIENDKGQLIEDDALFTQALYFEQLDSYTEAEANLLRLIDFHPESLLMDDSIFKLGELYRDHLFNNEKAKEMFERIIFEFPSSIYLVESRKAFRKLRGDDL